MRCPGVSIATTFSISQVPHQRGLGDAPAAWRGHPLLFSAWLLPPFRSSLNVAFPQGLSWRTSNSWSPPHSFLSSQPWSPSEIILFHCPCNIYPPADVSQLHEDAHRICLVYCCIPSPQHRVRHAGSGIKYIHSVVSSSPLSVFKTILPPRRTLYSCAVTALFFLPKPLVITTIHFLSLLVCLL